MNIFIANMIAILAASLLTLTSASPSVFPPRKTDQLSLARHGEAQSQTKSNCPNKWLDASLMDMGCLFFNATKSMTWVDANIVCQTTPNATLVDIATEVQMGFLQMELDVIANAEGTTHSWWTAGTDVGLNGRWIWATTLTNVGDFVWQNAYPSSNTNNNCLMLYPSYGYLAVNYPCDDASRYSICQLK